MPALPVSANWLLARNSDFGLVSGRSDHHRASRYVRVTRTVKDIAGRLADHQNRLRRPSLPGRYCQPRRGSIAVRMRSQQRTRWFPVQPTSQARKSWNTPSSNRRPLNTLCLKSSYNVFLFYTVLCRSLGTRKIYRMPPLLSGSPSNGYAVPCTIA